MIHLYYGVTYSKEGQHYNSTKQKKKKKEKPPATPPHSPHENK